MVKLFTICEPQHDLQHVAKGVYLLCIAIYEMSTYRAERVIMLILVQRELVFCLPIKA